MRPFFSSGGGGARPAGSGAVLGFRAGGRRRPVAGWAVMVAGPAGRPRPSGEGRENRLVGKKGMGRKAGWAKS
jgi:hypothetical protein